MHLAQKILFVILFSFFAFHAYIVPSYADWSFDADPPTTSITASGTGCSLSGSTLTCTNVNIATITVTCADPGAGASGCQYIYTNIAGRGYASNSSNPVSGDINSASGSDNSIVILAYSDDNAGNISTTVSFTITFLYRYGISGAIYLDPSHNCTGTSLAAGTVYLNGGSAQAAGAYSYPNLPGTSYTLSITPPGGYQASPCSTTSTSVTVPPDQTVNFYVTNYSITSTVYVDYNHNCAVDGSDYNAGAGPSMSGLTTGTYSLAYSVPAGYTISSCNTNPRSVTVPPDQSVNFFITPTYNITSYVLVDYNHDCNYSDGSVNGADVTYGNDGAAARYPGIGVALSGQTAGSTVTDVNGYYQYLGLISGNYTLTVNPASIPAGYTFSPCNATGASTFAIGPSRSWNYNDTVVTFYITPLYTLSGNSCIDYDHNGVKDAYDDNYTTGTASLSQSAARDYISPNPKTAATNGSGNYTFTNLLSGDYTISMAVPTNYQATMTTPQAVILRNGTLPTTKNFCITPLHSIAGNIYADINKNTYYVNPPDTLYSGGTSTIAITGPSIVSTTTSTGPYTTGQALLSGSYTVSYNGPPIGYSLNYPSPATFTVTIGWPGKAPAPYTCNTNSYHDAACATVSSIQGNITGLNFGITNSFAWFQGKATDMWCGNGFSDPIPTGLSTYANLNNPNNLESATGGTPGLIFTGNSDANFCPGYTPSGTCSTKSSAKQWVVGGNGTTGYPETFTPVNATVIRTSYTYMTTTARQSGLSPTDLATVCTISSCTIPANMQNGLYSVTGDLHLKASTFPVNRNFVILINGNLYIEGNVHVPTSSTATFSVSGNMSVDSSVGAVTNDLTTPNIEGFYSVDGSFSSSGNAGDCTKPADKRLNMQGAVVTNAGQTLSCSSAFLNQRDLCAQNLSYPSFYIEERPDFVLHAPDFIRHQTTQWQEIAP